MISHSHSHAIRAYYHKQYPGRPNQGVGLCIGGGRKSERVAQNGRLGIQTPRPTEGAVRADERSLGVSSCVVRSNTKPTIRERPRSPRWGQERAFKATAGLELS